jgi:hypothetical protein
VFHRDLVNTCQVFISSVEDLEVLAGPDSPRYALFSTANVLKDEEPHSKNLWLFDLAISTILPSSFDETWWQHTLSYVLRSDSFGPADIGRILQYCNTSTIRWGLCERIHDMYCFSELNDNEIGNFLLLMTKTDDLKFIHTDWHGNDGSPISIALRLSSSFVIFRSILIKAGYDLDKVIRDEIELEDNGWTETTLRKLFMLDVTPFVARGFFTCEVCHEDVSSLTGYGKRAKEVPWERMLQRLKDEVDLDAPLTDEEHREQKEWEGYAIADDEKICQQCHRKKIQFVNDEGDEDGSCPYLLCV